MNEPVTLPPEIVQLDHETEPLLPSIVHVESDEENPEPDTVTVAPACPELGFSVTDGVAAVSWK